MAKVTSLSTEGWPDGMISETREYPYIWYDDEVDAIGNEDYIHFHSHELVGLTDEQKDGICRVFNSRIVSVCHRKAEMYSDEELIALGSVYWHSS